ncbi:MAG: NRDE family protein [Pseudomonadota bacterium]
MCLILFSFDPDSNTPLILGANRDEFFHRPTAPAHFWEDHSQVLAGRDLQAGGTWLGISREGRFAGITNVREPGVVVENARSRGELTKDFLAGDLSPVDYLRQVESKQTQYSGFNLLLGDFSKFRPCLHYFSNREADPQKKGPQRLNAGTYGLSNHLLDSPWPKVDDGKQSLIAGLKKARGDHKSIRQLLENSSLADDHRLPETGLDYDKEKALSAIFIMLPDYGTRASTVISINQQHIEFSEQNYAASQTGQANRDGETSHFIIDRSVISPKTVAAK